MAASGRLFGDAEAEQAVDSVDSVDRSKALMLLGSPGWNFWFFFVRLVPQDLSIFDIDILGLSCFE